MRPRKFLLITKALTTAGLITACKKEDAPPPPPPGNPKGSIAYEQDAAPTPTPTPPPPPPPANPKGVHYDAEAPLPPPTKK
ncbi:MAG: hypothetical protein KIT84_37575 [Labilithrix sp.]|nr:hypothetical protein [Labilithrix sp.]MCW5816770.1 hypothetical protein [Labilithrix sp.]